MIKLENKPQMTVLAAKVMENEAMRQKKTNKGGQWRKVSPAMVLSIRSSSLSTRELAAKFNITKTHIAQIRSYKARKDVK